MRPSQPLGTFEPILTGALAVLRRAVGNNREGRAAMEYVEERLAEFQQEAADIAAVSETRPGAMLTLEAGPAPNQYATYLIDGKPHRVCDCDPHKGPCKLGLERKLLTCELSRCVVPDATPGVVVTETVPPAPPPPWGECTWPQCGCSLESCCDGMEGFYVQR